MPEVRESYEKVNARFWQDPFRAVLNSAKEGDPEPDAVCDFSVPHEKAICPLQQNIGKKENVTVLGVMVPGVPYDNDTEMRLRMRYWPA